MEYHRILLSANGKKFYVKNLDEDFHTQFGFVSKEQLNLQSGTIVKTNTGKELYLLEPSFIDNYRKIKRDAQIIPLKDIGVIISETGITSDSKVLDSGAGSGALSCYLAKIAKEVIAYEIRKDFIEIVEANKKLLKIKNLTVKNKNIYEEIEDFDFDVITLDLPEPWKALENCKKALKPGGFLVSYSPSIPQVADFVNAARANENFMYLKTIEIVSREWEVDERKVRPKTSGTIHSGFLSFIRRVR